MNVDMAQYAWMDEYCLTKKGVSRDYQPDWEATRYFVGSKLFALVGGDKFEKPIISVKLDPIFGQLLRDQYADIVPGYHLNKIHWVSLYIGGTVPNNVLRDMLDHAYQIVHDSLTKKEKQAMDEIIK
jgi:predicted DNA-binding protein (MmcQ/YjbR family)